MNMLFSRNYLKNVCSLDTTIRCEPILELAVESCENQLFRKVDVYARAPVGKHNKIQSLLSRLKHFFFVAILVLNHVDVVIFDSYD